jgi:hypothetical protein
MLAGNPLATRRDSCKPIAILRFFLHRVLQIAISTEIDPELTFVRSSFSDTIEQSANRTRHSSHRRARDVNNATNRHAAVGDRTARRPLETLNVSMAPFQCHMG